MPEVLGFGLYYCGFLLVWVWFLFFFWGGFFCFVFKFPKNVGASGAKEVSAPPNILFTIKNKYLCFGFNTREGGKWTI